MMYSWVIVLLIAVGVYYVYQQHHGAIKPGGGAKELDAHELLRQRLVRGEISVEEFEKLTEVLYKDTMQH